MRHKTSCIPLPHSFSLKQAVCSYGFFVLSPNKWRPQVEHLHSLRLPGFQWISSSQADLLNRKIQPRLLSLRGPFSSKQVEGCMLRYRSPR